MFADPQGRLTDNLTQLPAFICSDELRKAFAPNVEVKNKPRSRDDSTRRRTVPRMGRREEDGRLGSAATGGSLLHVLKIQQLGNEKVGCKEEHWHDMNRACEFTPD